MVPILRNQDAGVAHPVERHLAKVEVASSSLVTRSIKSLFCLPTNETFLLDMHCMYDRKPF